MLGNQYKARATATCVTFLILSMPSSQQFRMDLEMLFYCVIVYLNKRSVNDVNDVRGILAPYYMSM